MGTHLWKSIKGMLHSWAHVQGMTKTYWILLFINQSEASKQLMHLSKNKSFRLKNKFDDNC